MLQFFSILGYKTETEYILNYEQKIKRRMIRNVVNLFIVLYSNSVESERSKVEDNERRINVRRKE